MATNLKPTGFHKKKKDRKERQAEFFENVFKHASSTFRFLGIYHSLFFKQAHHQQ